MTGQREMQVGGFDPLLCINHIQARLRDRINHIQAQLRDRINHIQAQLRDHINHTQARLRDRIKRLARHIGCTTRRIEYLPRHPDIVIDDDNRPLRPRRFTYGDAWRLPAA